MKKVAVSFFSLIVVIFLFKVLSYAQILIVGNGQGNPRDTLAIPVTFSNDLNNVVAIQFDITFDPDLVDITNAVPGSALETNFSFSTNEPAPGIRRIVIIPSIYFPMPTLPDGEIAVISVYLVGAPGSRATLTLDNVVMCDADYNSVVPASLQNGYINITSITFRPMPWLPLLLGE